MDQQALGGLMRMFKEMFSGDTVDPKLWYIQQLKTALGEKAVEAVLLGLSRPVEPARGAVEQLISEWERRDTACCYTGSVADLFSLKETIIVALSYKHDHRSNWNRKGKDLTSKMTQLDQEDLVESVLGLGRFPKTSTIMVWCDQVISTRLRDVETRNVGWYSAGLLPFLGLPVLTLSTNIPEAILEERIWIKAERSLGRLGTGLLNVCDAKLGILSNVQSPYTAWEVLDNISLLILSGYWPVDTGFWKDDYQEMKMWALYLACKSNKYIEVDVQETPRPVDDIEILANIHHLSMVPQGITHKERAYHTADPIFFLKPTAWNLSLDEVWNKDDLRISHYFGKAIHYEFSWWMEAKSKTICGYLVSTQRACFVLAIKDARGYNVFRRGVDPSRYRHKEANLGSDMKSIIKETAQYFDVYADADAEWSLLFFCDENISPPVADANVKNMTQQLDSDADALVPYQFVGQTTSIYMVTEAVCKARGNSSDFGPELFLSLFEEWKGYIKKRYKNWISVRDTHSGPVWLEGYNEEYVSFGFLDFITRYLIVGDKTPSERVIRLPSKWKTLQEIRRAAAVATNDLKLIVDEIFGGIAEDACEESLTTADVAIFMVSGGFTSGFGNDRLSSFLKRSACARGYWFTRIYCRGGKMQVLFSHEREGTRILQREAKVKDFIAAGIVHPEDSGFVFGFTDKLSEDPDVYRSYKYWREGMKDTTTKTEMDKAFTSSRRRFCSDVVGTVDMTVGNDSGTEVCSVYQASRGSMNSVQEQEEFATSMTQILSTLAQREGSTITERLNDVLAIGESSELPNADSSFEEIQAFNLQMQKQRQEQNDMLTSTVARHCELQREIRDPRRKEVDREQK